MPHSCIRFRIPFHGRQLFKSSLQFHDSSAARHHRNGGEGEGGGEREIPEQANKSKNHRNSVGGVKGSPLFFRPISDRFMTLFKHLSVQLFYCVDFRALAEGLKTLTGSLSSTKNGRSRLFWWLLSLSQIVYNFFYR